MKTKRKQEKEVINDKNGDVEVFQAIVSNINNKQIQILIDGKIIPCLIPASPASRKYAPVVGDAVEICKAGNDQYRLVRILPRRTVLYRGDRRSPGDEVLIAANVQYLLAIVTAEYLINQAGFLEAAVIASRRSCIRVGLLISKWDLLGER
ncbi:MAG: ribosome small subunit-dependent GTPase A, partial [Bacillota bacterium]